jgi:hypothetical protein
MEAEMSVGSIIEIPVMDKAIQLAWCLSIEGAAL